VDPAATSPDRGERQPGATRPRFCPGDRAFLAALLHRFPGDVLGWFRLPVLRWHRALPARRHAARSRPKAPRPAGHRPLHPPAGASPGTGESLLGLPPHPRRTPIPEPLSSPLWRP
jgi:hypothetical protein